MEKVICVCAGTKSKSNLNRQVLEFFASDAINSGHYGAKRNDFLNLKSQLIDLINTRLNVDVKVE